MINYLILLIYFISNFFNLILQSYYLLEWTLWEEKSECKIYYYENTAGYRSVKAEIEIQKPIKELFEYIVNIDNNLKFNTDLETLDEVRKIDEINSIQYVKYKGKHGITPRDLVRITYLDFTIDKAMIFYTSNTSTNIEKKNGAERIELTVIIFN